MPATTPYGVDPCMQIRQWMAVFLQAKAAGDQAYQAGDWADVLPGYISACDATDAIWQLMPKTPGFQALADKPRFVDRYRNDVLGDCLEFIRGKYQEDDTTFGGALGAYQKMARMAEVLADQVPAMCGTTLEPTLPHAAVRRVPSPGMFRASLVPHRVLAHSPTALRHAPPAAVPTRQHIATVRIGPSSFARHGAAGTMSTDTRRGELADEAGAWNWTLDRLVCLPQDVKDRKNQVDSAMSALLTDASNCAATLPQNTKDDIVTFYMGWRQFFCRNTTGVCDTPDYTWIGLCDQLNDIDAWEQRLFGWQKTLAASNCKTTGPQGAQNPNPVADPILTAVRWGVVGAIVLAAVYVAKETGLLHEARRHAHG